MPRNRKRKRCKKCTKQFTGDGEECPECKAGTQGDTPADSGEKGGTSSSANRKWCRECNDMVDVLPSSTQTLRVYCSKCKQYNTLWEFPPPVLVTSTRDLPQSPPLQGQAGASAAPASKEQALQKQTSHQTNDLSRPRTNPVFPDVEKMGENFKVIHFHAILPKKLWLCDDFSSVRLRVGIPLLHNWEQDIGELGAEWSVETNNLNGEIMGYKMALPKDVLDRHIPYKYVVYSRRSNLVQSLWEFLHGCQSRGNCNRILSWKDLTPDAEGIYHQFDDLIYPMNTPSRPWYERVLGFNQPPPELNFTPMELQPMRTVCLHAYLGLILSTLDVESLPITSQAESILAVYYALNRRRVADSGGRVHKDDVDLTLSMAKWIESTIYPWLTGQSESRKLLLSFTLIHVIDKLQRVSGQLRIDPDKLCSLLDNITLQVDTAADKSPEVYEILLSLLPSQSRRATTGTAILDICRKVATRSMKGYHTCLKVVCYYHFLVWGMSPFSKLSEVDWERTSTDCCLLELKRSINNYRGTFLQPESATSTFKMLHAQGHFRADPHLLPFYLSLCPPESCAELLKHMKPLVAFHWLGDMNLLEKVSQTPKVQSILDALAAKLTPLEQTNLEITKTMTLCLKIVKKVLAKTSDSKVVKRLLGLHFKLVLGSAGDSRADPGYFEAIQKEVVVWIRRETAGESFGGESCDLQMEIEIWKDIFSVGLDDGASIGGELREAWMLGWKPILTDRVCKLAPVKRFSLFFITNEDMPVLSDVTADAVMVAIDRMSESECTSRAINTLLQQSSRRKGKSLGMIMAKILQKQYGTDAFSASFHDLMSWKLWPWFIEICANNSPELDGLPSSCQEACKGAIEVLDEVCDDVHKGEIKNPHLEVIIRNKSLFRKLVLAKLPAATRRSTIKALEDAIKQRQLEIQHFLEKKKQLKYLIERINVEVQGLSELEMQVMSDMESTCSIRSLCTSGVDQSDFEVLAFDAAKCLMPVIENFRTMHQERNSDIFVDLWRKNLERAACESGDNLTFKEVVEMAWEPSFQECKQLREQLHDRTVTMATVNERFHRHDKSKIVLVLKALVMSLDKCHSKTSDTASAARWAQSITDLMSIHWQLSSYQKVAVAFLGVKKELELTGDFQSVEKLLTMVQGSEAVSTLGDARKDVVQAGETLKQFAGCDTTLEAVQKSYPLLKWIYQDVCKDDIGDLQSFVTVSLATAAGGEDALTRDKLSDLVKVGTSFAPFIFMKTSVGFKELVTQCASVWEAVKTDSDLPELLVQCQRNLSWYQSVKETHGSVEATSFGQMTSMINYGRYVVGSILSAFQQTLGKIIRIELTEKDKALPKKHYTLEEIQDLESRLVLITGGDAAERKEVDEFLEMLSVIRRVAKALVELQQSGKVKYIGWQMSFPCKPDECKIMSLTNMAQNMEDELEDWRGEVDSARKQFYGLNCYTMKQLLDLRKELGNFKSAVTPTLPCHVLTLLQSISPTVTVAVISSAFQPETPVESDSEETTVEDWNISSDTGLQRDDDVSSNASTYMSLALTSDSPVDNVEELGDLSDLQHDQFYELTDDFGYPSHLAKEAVALWDNIDQAIIYCDLAGTEIDGHVIPSWLAKDATAKHDKLGEAVNWCKEQIHRLPCSTRVGTKDMPVGDQVEKTEADRSHSADIQDTGDEREPEESQPVRKRTSEQHEVERKYFDIQESSDAEEFLSLDELGRVLSRITRILRQDHVHSQRPFPSRSGLKFGVPNLIVTNADTVFRTVLSLYMQDTALPLPTFEEVLLCNEKTTSEEVILLWRRALFDPGRRRIFCLVHGENLPYSIADRAIQTLQELSKGIKGYRIVLVCSSDDDDKSHFITKLHLYRREYNPAITIEKYKAYLSNQFDTTRLAYQSEDIFASVVDKDQSSVRVVYSNRAGMGKSLYIRRMAERLGKMKSSGMTIATIPIHGPAVSPDVVMNILGSPSVETSSNILHFDISPSVFTEVADIIFCLVILKAIKDSHGRVWRAHPSQLLAIELTTPTQQDMLRETSGGGTMDLVNLLPKVKCISPRMVLKHIMEGKQDDDNVSLDISEFQTRTYQRVYQYLKRHRHSKNLDDFVYEGDLEDQPEDCIQVLCMYCGIQNPSWSEIRHFVQFLNIQLHDCETSVYLKETVPKLKTFVVRFLVRMSTDFATSSLSGEVALEEGTDTGGDEIEQLQIVPRNRWEQRPHPYIFFNKDHVSATFVGFTVTREGDLWDPRNPNFTETGFVPVELLNIMERLKFNEDYQTWSEEDLVAKLCNFLGFSQSHNPDPSYVLTVDNFIKILGIQMRFRCGIPVVVMGETGCGKTRLIRYMCDLAARRKPDDTGQSKNLIILKVHGGTTESTITEYVRRAISKAEQNLANGHGLETVLFFDEANTTEAIGLIKEVMCDRRVQGRAIPPTVKFIAACNPYRKHDPKMIEKLEHAGLGFFVKHTRQRLGKIPLRQLVYRVLDLPSSMRPLVYDFGHLSDETELDYTTQIVKNHVRKMPNVTEREKERVTVCIAKVLARSQRYMRERKDECSFVSLRDVERAMIVFEYFYLLMDKNFKPHVLKKAASENRTACNSLTRSLILALGVCYHARLQHRETYEENITKEFQAPLYFPDRNQPSTAFKKELSWCQEILLDRMKLDDNIAKNAALRENVFMMTVCMELRIPLFLVGKPGSSKSLAKSVVSASLNGKASSDPFLKNFKQVQMFSYQCSQYSTPESIVEAFDLAKEFQEKRNTTEYVSVVVLDEVGLAEDSPALPLKVLHPLLEDGTEGGDSAQQVVERTKRVAFIGISNWALDPAKMNRGVMVTRDDPDTEELVKSARGICSNKPENRVQRRLEPDFKALADSYTEICRKVNEKRVFYGLRDFYSLIKMLYWLCEKSGMEPNAPQLRHAIARNFGGTTQVDVLGIFFHYLGQKPEPAEEDKEDPYINPNCSPLGLLKAALTSEEGWENRYLMFLTENYVALNTLRHFLQGNSQLTPACSHSPDQGPFILFGSSFPRDQEYTQACRNINQIKLCMETGRTVVLLNLGNLYESLYDVLNQYYLKHGGKSYVDLGLQAHRVKCQVHKDFRLILIAESKTVYDKFPTPLINRLEKHFILSRTLLSDSQQEVLTEFMQWIESFITPSDGKLSETFKPQDAFTGYQDDTPAAVVLQASPFLTETSSASFEQKQQALRECKRLLLQTATPDAIIRLKSTQLKDEAEDFFRMYFSEQHHSSVNDFLCFYLDTPVSEQGMLMQLTTHGRLLNHEEAEELWKSLEIGGHPQLVSLQQFQTEVEFTNKISTAFEPRETLSHSLLIIQCDSGHLNGDLIACARYRVSDIRGKQTDCRTHVLFIVQLPRKVPSSSFVGFQGNPWICAHVDNLCIDSDSLSVSAALLQAPISELFYSLEFVSDSSDSSSEITTSELQYPPQCQRLNGCIHAAASRLYDAEKDQQRITERVERLKELIPEEFSFPLDERSFHGAVVKHILHILQRHEHVQTGHTQWVLDEALNPKHLQFGGTFTNVLVRKIEETLIPILAEIIAAVDFNYNLNLLRIQPVQEELHSRIHSLWISMFRDVCQFDVGAHQGDQVPGVGGHFSEIVFRCKLPFSWIIKDKVENEWSYAQSSAGSCDDTLHDELLKVLSGEPVGKVLEVVDPKHVETFAEYYLHDFVRSRHKCNHKNPAIADMEYKIICVAVKRTSDYAEFCHRDSLLSVVITFHICYEKMKDQILWFGELGSYIPGIIPRLSKQASHDIALHLDAANAALCSSELNISESLRKGLKATREWLQKMYKSQTAISAILCLDSQHSLAPIIDIRKQWSVLLALQKFVEHVLLRDERLKSHARRLEKFLQMDSDLMKASSFDMLEKQLSDVDRALAERLKLRGEKRSTIRESCAYFFLEVMTRLWFGGDSLPEDGLIDRLIEMAFPFEGRGAKARNTAFILDAVPGFPFILLRLLLQHKTDQVRHHLENFMHKYSEWCTRNNIGKKEQFLQFIQCFEDCLSVDFSNGSIEHQISKAAQFLGDGYDACAAHVPANSDEVNIDFLLGIGQIRFSLAFATDLLSDLSCTSVDDVDTKEFLEKVKDVTCDGRLIFSGGSAESFLLQTLVRWKGHQCLMILAHNPTLRSIVPQRVREEDDQLIDPFVIYNPQYADLRECVATAVDLQDFADLQQLTKNLNDEDAVPLLLVLYKKVTLASSSLENETKKPFLRFIEETNTISQNSQLKRMAEMLVENSLGTPLRFEPEQDQLHSMLTGIAIHFVSVLFCKPRHEVLRVFYALLQDPSSLKESYLPTMPEIITSPEAQIGVRFYECGNGHRFHAYAETRSTLRKSEVVSCHLCGYEVNVNRYIGTEVTSSRRGYVLGLPTAWPTPDPERKLSAASCAIIRILMHSALLWTSSNDDDLYTPVAKLMSLNHKKIDVTDACLECVKCNLHLLSRIIGRSIDETVLTVHIILRDILIKNPPDVTREIGCQCTPEARSEWEDLFDAEFIQPTLQDLAGRLHRAIMNNDKKKHNKIFATVYGQRKSTEGTDLPNLWVYRPRVTLDHLPQMLPYKEITAKHRMLHLFLIMEPNLRATKYIPDLQQLQQRLHDRFHHRIDAQQAASLTLGEFLEQENEQYSDLFDSLKRAWSLAREKLSEYAKSYLLMDEKDLIPSIDDSTPLKYLIPTAEGPGACTIALMKYLVLLHNHFIQSCIDIAEKQPESKTPWKKRCIPLSRVQHCHLLDYEKELVSLVLSHCHYVGAPDEGQVRCNLPALEKHILDNFIHGKPVISLEVPQVAYRRKGAVQMAATLVAVRKKVPQKELPLHVQLGILKELNEMHHLNQTLEGVNVMLGFLHYGGVKPAVRLQDYRKKTLKMERHPFSRKADESCNLEHIVSLWTTLSVQLAKQHTLTDQEPFEHIPEGFQEEFIPEDVFQKPPNDMTEREPKWRIRKALANLDENQLLHTLFEFIETNIKHARESDSDKMLIVALERYIIQNKLQPIQRLKEEFEGFAIPLGQAASLWKYIVKPADYVIV